MVSPGRPARAPAGDLCPYEGCPVTDRPQLRIELHRPSDTVAVVTPDGDVDFFTAPTLDQVLRRDVDGTAQHVIVDLSSVAFMDSAALGVLISSSRRLKAEGASLLVVCGSGYPQRLIEITALNLMFPVHSLLVEALAAAEQETSLPQ